MDDLLCSDIINLLIENYFGFEDSLALFRTSKIFSVYRQSYGELIWYAKGGVLSCTFYGKLDAIKLIYRRKKFNIDFINEEKIDYTDKDYFGVACGCGHLDTARWFFQLCTKTGAPINIHDSNDFVFRYSCWYGYLGVAQWLIQVGIETKSPIDIHVVIDYPLKRKSLDGPLDVDVARWLIQLGIETNSPIDLDIFQSRRL